MPVQAGIEWLEPTVRDELAVTGSKLGGSRRFSYLARVTKPGSIDLGSISLPHYNPAIGRYEVARAALGHVTAEPAATPATAPSDGSEAAPRLSELVRFRTQLGPSEPRSFLADRRAFWWLLALGPGLVLGFALAVVAGRGARQRLREREQSQATHASRALGDAKKALAASELRDVASSAERAIYNAIEWATGLRVRAVLRSDLERTLEGASLSPDVAQRSAELLDRCGQLRFSDADQARANALVRDVERLVRQLVRRPPARAPHASGEEARS
jgi:hypothetical protein